MLEFLRQTFDVVFHLVLAYLAALPVGWERDVEARSAGLRTFPLVALGACAYMLLGRTAFGSETEAQARVIQGLLSGMGFIGGGAILKGKRSVRGLATAASIWNTGAIGAAVALDQFAMAVSLSLANLATLHLLARFRHPRGIRVEDEDEEQPRSP